MEIVNADKMITPGITDPEGENLELTERDAEACAILIVEPDDPSALQFPLSDAERVRGEAFIRKNNWAT